MRHRMSHLGHRKSYDKGGRKRGKPQSHTTSTARVGRTWELRGQEASRCHRAGQKPSQEAEEKLLRRFLGCKPVSTVPASGSGG